MKSKIRMDLLLSTLSILCFLNVASAADFQSPFQVGSKKFTESVILGDMVTLLVESQGVPAIHRDQLGGTRILWNALRKGDIDVYPEYTGTIRIGYPRPCPEGIPVPKFHLTDMGASFLGWNLPGSSNRSFDPAGHFSCQISSPGSNHPWRSGNSERFAHVRLKEDSEMPTILVLYPAYGTTSCGQVARYAQQIIGLKLALANDEPTSYDEDIFNEVVEVPPPEHLARTYEIMRRWCEKRHPDGIFLQSERGLLLGSLLAREFNLKGPTVEAAHLCSNKYLQRVVLSRAGIAGPLFSLAESATDVHRLARDFGFPLVLKCVISTMSRLVTPVCSKEDIDTAVAHIGAGLSKSLDVTRLVSFAQTGKVDLGCDPRCQFLVESFLGGDFVETDGLVVGNKPFTFGVTEQVQSVNPPFFIEGYLFPAECSDNEPIEAVSDAIIDTIGLGDSAFSIEMRVCGREICVVEVNGRLGWDEGFSDLFQVRTHRERIFQTLQLALGMKPDLIRDVSRFAALAYRPCYYDGIIEDLPTREDLARLGHDHLKLGLATHEGARFVAPPNPEAYPHVAWALAKHPSSSHMAYEIARKVVDELDISIRRI